jgi:hypothetical protein
VQSHSSPLPSASIQHRKFRLSSPNVSTNLVHIIRENPTKKLRGNSVTQPSPYSLSPSRQQDGLRAFDALLKFLSSGVPDKALLKQAILVTTLSARYLTVQNPSYHSEKARSSWFKAISIISVPSPDEHNSLLRLFHASLGDFLTNRSRCSNTFFRFWCVPPKYRQ